MKKQERIKTAQRMNHVIPLHPEFQGMTVNEIFSHLIKKGEMTTGPKSVPQKLPR